MTKKFSHCAKFGSKDPKFPTNPNIFGPGIWLTIHILAILVKTDNDIDQFIKSLHNIFDKIPCNECYLHTIDYLRLVPPYLFRNVINNKMERIGMFIWSWKFHNNVNLRLNKSLIDYETAYNMYNNINHN